MIWLDTREKNFEKKFSVLLKNRASFKSELEQKVREIFSWVEKQGINALLDFVRRYEGFKGTSKDLKVKQKEIEQAEKKLTGKQIKAIKLAKNRIEKFHKRQIPKGYKIKEQDGYLEERWVALSRVGIYIPAGKAPLASTVLMTGVPAKLAGVKEIIITTPAGKDGKVHPAILFCAQLLGIKEIYKVGGAQAIACLALGAEPIKKVDKIVGPGGVWVSSAKVYAQSQGLCGIDTLAGPSEILILSDGSVRIEFAQADLFAQLEHGEDSWAFLISANQKYLERLISPELKGAKNLVLIYAESENQMLELANQIAPEHLELHLENPEEALPHLSTAPAIFIGGYSPVAIGDYLAGPNHSLPTGGRARFDSPLGVRDFMKRQSIVKIGKILFKELSDPLSTFVELEGLSAHSRSIKIRLKNCSRKRLPL